MQEVYRVTIGYHWAIKSNQFGIWLSRYFEWFSQYWILMCTIKDLTPLLKQWIVGVSWNRILYKKVAHLAMIAFPQEAKKIDIRMAFVGVLWFGLFFVLSAAPYITSSKNLPQSTSTELEKMFSSPQEDSTIRKRVLPGHVSIIQWQLFREIICILF